MLPSRTDQKNIYIQIYGERGREVDHLRQKKPHNMT